MDDVTCNAYKQQLRHIEITLDNITDETEKGELEALRSNILELLSLVTSSENNSDQICNNHNEAAVAPSSNSHSLDEEYALFMAEMEKEGAVDDSGPTSFETVDDDSSDTTPADIKSLEGTKCRAPHTHHWGDVVYHNAMICSVLDKLSDSSDFKVKVLFTNPTHQEMLPCPYFFENDCKFTEDKCRFSHGEVVRLSELQEYIEPKFELLSTGSSVLAKQENNLWGRALVKHVYPEKCLVKFELNQKMVEVDLEHLFPLVNKEGSDHSGDDLESLEHDSEIVEYDRQEIINKSLMTEPAGQALGEWEKHTKGIGSKLMAKMGYVIGTGLGSKCDGRLEPVTAVILPPGKSLDHCMNLREKSGGSKNLFNAERVMKRIQRRQHRRNIKKLGNEKARVNIFNFLNRSLSLSQHPELSKQEHKKQLKGESAVNLNIASLKTEENIKRVTKDIQKLKSCLTRYGKMKSQTLGNLNQQLDQKFNELNKLQEEALNIKNEKDARDNKKKMSIF